MLKTIRDRLNRIRSQPDEWVIGTIAILTALMGVVNILSAMFPAMLDRLKILRQYLPLEVRSGSHLAATLAGFALLLLAANLWRRKQVAWLLTLVVLLVSVVSHLLKGLDYEEAALAFTLGTVLFFMRPYFHARSDPPSLRRGLGVLAASVVFTLAYGILGFYLLDRHFSIRFDLPQAIRQTIIMFTQFTDPGLQPITGFGRYFVNSIYMVAVITISYSLLNLVRPVLVRQPATAAERARAKTIVESFGCSSLARYTLFEDKSYYFSPGGTMLAFVVKGRIALVLGDPIGPPEDVITALESFKDYCAHNDWQASYYQVHPNFLQFYKSAGYSALCIGQEAVVNLSSFTLEGKSGKEFRTVINRFNRMGYQTAVYQPPLGKELLNELRSISDEWLTMQHGAEMRFASGWFDDDYVRNSVVMAVLAADGRIRAFANLVPEYQRNEMAIDLMRRRRESENGTMDYLFGGIFQWAKGQGLATFNLGLSALSGIGEHSDDPIIERALRYIYENVDRFYNFKGLHAFKEKYNPEWQPRYLIYPNPASLPLVARALVQATSGDMYWWSILKENFGKI